MNLGITVTLASIYTTTVIDGVLIKNKKADFFSFEGVCKIFETASKETMMIIWIHMVIWDLFVGGYIANDYSQNIVKTKWTKAYNVLCLLCTMMYGPTGFLLHLLGKNTFLPQSK